MPRRPSWTVEVAAVAGGIRLTALTHRAAMAVQVVALALAARLEIFGTEWAEQPRR